MKTLPITWNQGVARIPGGWILSGTPLVGTDNIARATDDLSVAVTNPLAIPAQWRAQGFDHIGDIDIYQGHIYAPFEQPDYSKGEQATATYDVTTLLFQKAWTVHQHENSFVTIDPQTGVAFSMQHFNGRYLTRNDANHGWKHLPALRMSQKLFHTQGADVARGYVWISTSDKHNDLYRVDERTGVVDHLGPNGHIGDEGEGLDATGLPSGDLHVLIRVAGTLTVDFKNFALVPDGSSSGAGPGGSGTTGGVRSPSGSSKKSGGRLATTGTAPLLAWVGALAAVAAIAVRRMRLPQ